MIEQIKQLIEENPFISYSKIAKELNVSKGLIQYHCNKNGIERDRKLNHLMNAPTKSTIKDISEEYNSFITGSLLGDGCLSKYDIVNSKTKHNSKLSMLHSIKQKDYVLYKKFLLDSMGIINYYNSRLPAKTHSIVNGRVIKDNGSVILTTEKNKNLNSLRDLWYPEDKKIVPESIQLTPLALAIWYMDDGAKNSSGYYLHTEGFDEHSSNLLINKLEEINIKSNLHKIRNYTFLYISKYSVDAFNDFITSFICQSMQYKLHGPKEIPQIAGTSC